MGEEVRETNLHDGNSGNEDQNLEFDIYPLSSYYFGSKDAIPFKDFTLLRIQSKFLFFHPFTSYLNLFLLFSYHFFFIFFISYAARGLRTSVEAVLLVRCFFLQPLSSS